MDRTPDPALDSEAAALARFLPIFRRRAEEVAARLGAPTELQGPGDDCAVLDFSAAPCVVSTDTQTEGQDFLLHWPSGRQSTGFDIGWKSAAQNLADVAAMGADPRSLLVSLTLPRQCPPSFLEDFARGMVAALDALGAPRCTVSGGDLGAGEQLSVTATAMGLCTAAAPVRRDGARPGDLVVLAGTVGTAAAGLALLQDATGILAGNDTEQAQERFPGASAPEVLARAQQRPRPPVALGAELARRGARAMIDVSDGLLRDAARVAQASGVRIELDRHALEPLVRPLALAADLLGRDPWEWVLAGGEDHGLLAVCPQGTRLPPGVRGIGSCRLPGPGEAPVGIEGQVPQHLGWDHFAAQARI